MSRPAPSDESGFELDCCLGDEVGAVLTIIGAIAFFAVVAWVWIFVVLDRSPTLPGDSLSPHWLRAPAQGFEREKRP